MINIRFARFSTGLILTVDGEDRWIERADLERFIAKALRARDALDEQAHARRNDV